MSDSTPQHAAPQRRLRIFLCHSSADKPAVRDLYKRLQADGFQPWLDEEDLIPGEEWEPAIRRAVRAADVVLVCLTPQAVTEAGFRHKEIRIALDVADEQPEGTIYIIPLRLEACEVPERLRRWHWVNHYEERSYERLTRALGLRAQDLGSAPSSPTDPASGPVGQSIPPPPNPTAVVPLPPLNPRDPRLVKARGLIARKQWVEALQSYEALAAEFTLPQRDGRYFEQARQEAWRVRTTVQAEEAEQRFDWEVAVALWAELAARLPDNTMIVQRLERARDENELAAWTQDAADLVPHAEWEAILALAQQIEQQRPGYRHPQIDLAALQRQALVALAYEQAVAQAEQEDWASVIATLAAVPDEVADDDLRALLAHAQDGIARQQRAAAERAYRERFIPVQEWIDAKSFDQAIDRLDAILQKQPDDREATTLVARLIERVEVPFDQRWRAAELAGRVGDPRFPVMLDEWRAAIAGAVRAQHAVGAQHAAPVQHYFCRVERGIYHIGGWEEGEKSADITLPGFWVARYPITVAQYRAFMEAGGYDEQNWWTPNGWNWKGQRTQPWNWNESPWDGANQPVIGISWYEAAAFAAWLTDQVKNALPHGCVIRLPSEAEWETAAAHGDQGTRRTYPWGEDEPTMEHAIYDVHGIEHPVPVGCCPAGAAACGAMDMAGNVWEATTSSYAGYPAQSRDLQKDFTTGNWHVPWRGGAWSSNRTSVRCGARYRNLPVYYFYFIQGFRVFLAPPLEQMS